ncbi:MAG: 5-oxoprolinase, partial [Gammaproteobacteria bacterium]
AITSEEAGFEKIIGFDMGGTSTDVCHYAGEYERAFDTLVAGVRLRVPIMRIHTVAAGGGSICRFDGHRLRVGPESAGADPGPACYRRGGPLTVTDCNVLLGRIQPRFFPRVFGTDGGQGLDTQTVRRQIDALVQVVSEAHGQPHTAEQIAHGFIRIAVENMANAIKKISVQRGYDVTEYTLTCFGGAGGQHACAVADALGMRTVLLHPLAGVLSAYGMGLAEVRVLREVSVEEPLTPEGLAAAEHRYRTLEDEARERIAAQLPPNADIQMQRNAHVRYADTDTAIAVPYGSRQEMVNAFESAHRERFGFLAADTELVLETAAVEAVSPANRTPETKHAGEAKPLAPVPCASVRMHANGEELDTPVFRRADLVPGHDIRGPAIIVEANSTTVVDPGWQAEVTAREHLVLRKVSAALRGNESKTTVDPVMLEVFNNLFMSIAEQMGAVLENTARSVNIKERLDFSCAIFDAKGNLVANAPHMPVHLGSMGESVKSVLAAHGDGMQPGDVFALNAPYNGGTHLPDITVVTPVFHGDEHRLQFFAACRGHHADIGGITPGSMPPHSRHIDEEGVLLDNVKLVEGGVFLETAILESLCAPVHPARNPEQNVADLKAQVAANEMGVRELNNMVSHFGLDVVRAYMGHVQDNAEAAVRRVLSSLADGDAVYPMDFGGEIRVAVRVNRAKRRAVVDFSGTSPQSGSNFNAPLAVCRAAVLYVFRALVNEDIPLNDGCLLPLELVVPRGCLLNPQYPAAVVAGNVETSQCIVNALLQALGVAAAAQGSMNNFTFGNAQYQYYETLCGGVGAGPAVDGTDAVHSHMTNSRLTDPEVLEWRFPVLLEAFSIRRGSGGHGRHRGGDGVIRRLRFREPMTAAILSGHRSIPPPGLGGGEPGHCGRNFVERADGHTEQLKAADQTLMQPGDVFVIQTPGGGGYGKPS